MATQNFYCCYLLTSLSPRCINHTYVGFTNHPARRIRQHNGEIKNGAKQTSKKRPWEMVLLVHGFPSKRAALYFEWSWQHPRDAKGIREKIVLMKGIGKEHLLAAKIRFLFEMLNLPPWNRFPLTVHWFHKDKYHGNLANCPALPAHMSTNIGSFGDIYIYKNGFYSLTGDDEHDDNDDNENSLAVDFSVVNYKEDTFAMGIITCCQCKESIETESQCVWCPLRQCTMVAHMRCLALSFLKDEPSALLPTRGQCPSCTGTIKWSEIISAKRDKSRQQQVKKKKRKKSTVTEPLLEVTNKKHRFEPIYTSD